MNPCLPDEQTLERMKTAIMAVPPRPHHSTLLQVLSGLLPGCEFRYALSRGGWHRLGGVIRQDGTRISRNIESWLKEALIECDGDLAKYVERYRHEGLLATRHNGKSHYLVAHYGPDSADFVQIEIEETQEVVARLLVNPAHPPQELFELTDPIYPAVLDAAPVGSSRYRFRRLANLRQVMARQAMPGMSVAPLARFMNEWDSDRKVRKGHFSDHWVVGIQDRLDRYSNALLSTKPVSRYCHKLETFPWQAEVRGVELADQIQAFDRVAGYADAWYFHMVTGRLVPHSIAYALDKDLESSLDYLAASGKRLLEGWLEEPYFV